MKTSRAAATEAISSAGEYNHDDDSTPSSHVRQVTIASDERQTRTTDVRSHGVGCETVQSKANSIANISTNVPGTHANAKAHAKRVKQQYDTIVERTVFIAHGEHPGDRQFG